MTAAYPLVEVARHTSRKDCWMVIEGKVYNVTEFMDEHPGGEDILLDSSGRDATREFEDVGHSNDAREKLEELLVGTVRDPTPEELAAAAEEAAKNGSFAAAAGESMLTKLTKWLVPFVIVGVAFLISRYAK